MTQITCSIQECLLPKFSRGFCQKHYVRVRKWGDPLHITVVQGENRGKHPLYKVYHAMLDRCRNPKNKMYSYYGERGITVCERWQGPAGFSNFIADMGERPAETSLDRTNNSRGYTPGNCRWATKGLQQFNQRINRTNTSEVKGVSQFKRTGAWQAYINFKSKRIHLGYYKTKDDATLARKAAELRYY